MRGLEAIETRHVAAARPASLLFAVAVAWGVLAPTPGLRTISGLIGANPFALTAIVWAVLTIVNARGKGSGAFFAVFVIFEALVGVSTGASLRVWVGGVIAPLMLFAGLQYVDQVELRHARRITRWVLFAAVALDVLYYARAAGPGLVSPSFVFGHHDDLTLWAAVGDQLLGNPNNASVVFCAAFAWACVELSAGERQRFTRVFVVVSALAVFSTGSRGALLTAVLTALAAAFVKVRGRRKTRTLLLAGGGIIYAANYWLTRIAPNTTHSAGDETARLSARAATLPEVLSHPFGTGPGTAVDTLQGALSFVFRANNVGVTSHDIFLNWGVATGWVGLGLLLYAVIRAVRSGWRAGGLLAVLPLLAFLLDAESAGIDALNPSNAAWSVMLWTLIGLGWRGGVLNVDPRVHAEKAQLTRHADRPADPAPAGDAPEAEQGSPVGHR